MSSRQTHTRLFRHESNGITFCLVVDDFGVKFTDKAAAEHLRDAHCANITPSQKIGKGAITVDSIWSGTAPKNDVDISMKGYVEKALQRFQHDPPIRPQHSPSGWTRPNCGAKEQLAESSDDSEALSKESITRLQTIMGTFLCCGRAVDNTMLVALGTLGSAQSKGTQKTMEAAVHLLNCAATHPDAKVRFHASDMVPHIHSDASYLSEPEAKSRVGGYFFLGGKDNPDPNSEPPAINGAIHVESSIMRNVMSSAAEAETGGLFVNGQAGQPIQVTLGGDGPHSTGSHSHLH